MILIVLVLLGLAIVTGFALVLHASTDGLADAEVDAIDLGLPDRAITANDIERLHFRTGLRGYRMEDVDRALAQIAAVLPSAEPSVAVATTAPVEAPAFTEPVATEPAQDL